MSKKLTFTDLISDEASDAQVLIDYYEGRQLNHLVKALNQLRRDWQNRKFRPRVRNITKTIVDKSGLLFNAPPMLEIINEQGKPITDLTFNQLLDRSDWLEFFQNVDIYTRLLKTTCVLQQKFIAAPAVTKDGKYVPNFQQGDALLLTLLTRANSAVLLDITGTVVVELAFLTSDIKNGDFTYRSITPELIADYEVHNQKESLIASQPNPDGFVPASMFYDTNKPRNCAWFDIPEDIASLQEMVNLALTDTEFAIAHQKQKTLFTNASLVGSSARGQSGPLLGIPHAEEGYTPGGTAYPSTSLATNSEMGGLGAVVTISTGDPGVQPYLEFAGPESDLVALDEVMSSLAKQVAYDWSVSMRTEGSGKANSGFQIVVEEMDNLQLRDKRAQSMQAALRRFYGITQRLYPTLTTGSLRAKFAPASLPVNTQEQENLWSQRIKEGRASVLDYFKEVSGLSDQEAWEKIKEIQSVNAALGLAPQQTADEQAEGASEGSESSSSEEQSDSQP